MKKTIKAYLDRIEGKTAVFYLGKNENHKVDIPLTYLPKGCNEGQPFNITFEKIDTDTGKEIEDLRKKLLQEKID